MIIQYLGFFLLCIFIHVRTLHLLQILINYAKIAAIITSISCLALSIIYCVEFDIFILFLFLCTFYRVHVIKLKAAIYTKFV